MVKGHGWVQGPEHMPLWLWRGHGRNCTLHTMNTQAKRWEKGGAARRTIDVRIDGMEFPRWEKASGMIWK